MSEYVYGRNSVKEVIRSGRAIRVYCTDDHEMTEELRKARIPYESVQRKRLDQMAKGGNHQGIIAEVKPFRLSRLEELIREKNGFIVMLDGLQDVHNLGAVIRTAECAGVDGIIYKKHGSVKINDTVAKVASGALEYMKICEVTNLVNAINTLKEAGYWVVGTDGKAKQSYSDLDYDFNTVLVIGAEGEGISRLTKENCDYLVSLPLEGHINSLNASVAAGIMIYEVLEKRSH